MNLLKASPFLMVLSVALVGCVSPARQETLLGTWVWDEPSVIVTVTFYKNHEYRLIGALNDGTKVDAHESGHWRIQGRKLVMVTETSSMLPASEGRKQWLKIIRLEGDSLILKGKESPKEPQQIMEFTRQ